MEEIKLSNVESLSGLVNMIGLATLYNSQKGQNALIEISKKEIVVSYVRDNCVAIHKSPYTINDVFGVELSKYIGDKTLIFKPIEQDFNLPMIKFLSVKCKSNISADIVLNIDDNYTFNSDLDNYGMLVSSISISVEGYTATLASLDSNSKVGEMLNKFIISRESVTSQIEDTEVCSMEDIGDIDKVLEFLSFTALNEVNSPDSEIINLIFKRGKGRNELNISRLEFTRASLDISSEVLQDKKISVNYQDLKRLITFAHKNSKGITISFGMAKEIINSDSWTLICANLL